MSAPPRDRWEGLKTFRDGWIAALPGVAANLTAVFLLFLFSLIFAPVRQALFGLPSHDYPLQCFFDAVASKDDPDFFRVELFVANPTDEDWDGKSLQTQLDAAFKDTGARAKVAMPIEMQEGRGRIVDNPADRKADAEFNKGKGEIALTTVGGTPTVTIEGIAPRSVLRQTIRIADSPSAGRNIDRVNRSGVPFDYVGYQEACFGR